MTSEGNGKDTPQKARGQPVYGQTRRTELRPSPSVELPYRQRRVSWPAVLFAALAATALAISGWALFFGAPDESTEEDRPSFVVPASPTPPATPSATPSATPKAVSAPSASGIAFQDPTATPTPVPGGRVLILTPEAVDAGWVVSDDESIVTIYDPQNHFGDSYLYAGVLKEKVYHAAFLFDLTRILPGTRIYGASLRLTGLRSDQLAEGSSEKRYLRLLAPEIDYYWRTVNYQQLHNAVVQVTFEPSLTQADLEEGKTSVFEFTPEQIAFLEHRLNSSDRSGRKVSFRLDGPTQGGDNLFAWDSGHGRASEGAGPELFLNLGPPPLETPTPLYVMITSTPTPEQILTAVADARHMTAEATRIGTATPLPPHWVTPFVVTATPTPANEATAQMMNLWATATVLAGGLPPNVVTATPTPTYMIVTSTPTPEDVKTAIAIAQRMTAQATRVGTTTPLPTNWVTPVVVTATPTPANTATAEYLQLALLITGSPTPTPANLQTATPTPTYFIITSTPTPKSIMTAAANSLQLTAEATQIGTATPLPTNWVTPVVVTSTPTPASGATSTYWQVVALTTGTPTPTPANVQTATPTPVFVVLEGELPTPAPTPTPTATPQYIPPELVGKIAFLSDRAYHADARTEPVEGEEGLPLGEPLVYVIDPDGGNLALLPDRWPYDLAIERDVFSADQRFRVFVKDAIIDTGRGGSDGDVVPIQLRVPALFVFDFYYQVEEQLTHFGVDPGHQPVAYDPAWSPTAEQIAFVSNDSGNDEIWVVNRDGGGARQLTRDEWSWWDKLPSWSPDGSKIVFWSNRTGNRSIWVMDADGGNLHCLSRTGFNDWDPVWIKYADPPRPLPTPPPTR